MMKIEIVKFEDGKFGIRRKYKIMFFMTGFEFLSSFTDNWWDTKNHVENFCTYCSESEARKRLTLYLGKSELPQDLGTPVDKL